MSLRALIAPLGALVLLACTDKSGPDDSEVGHDSVAGDDSHVTGDDSQVDDSAVDDSGEEVIPNVLQSRYNGGSARVVAWTALTAAGVEDTTLLFNGTLNLGCAYGWEPQGSLCDEPPTQNDLGVSTKSIPDSGATWYAYDGDGQHSTGVLIIDACAEGACEAIAFNEARVFQMYSDGKTTHLALYGHAARGGEPPGWDDEGWTTIIEESFITAGVQVDDFTVGGPAAFSFDRQETRYLKVEVKNDGAHGDDFFTELRVIKLFEL